MQSIKVNKHINYQYILQVHII